MALALSRRPLLAAAMLSLLGCTQEGDTTNNYGSSGPGGPTPDTTPPVVSITTPATGLTFRLPRAVPLRAAASDNVEVVSVSFRRNGSLFATVTAPPWETTFNPGTLAPAGSQTFVAVATDAAGNSTASTPVSVTTLGSGSVSGAAADYSVFGASNGDGNLAIMHPVAGGDVNGDGIPDVAYGVPYGDGPGDVGTNRGEVHVLYGSPTFATSRDLSVTTANVTIFGTDNGDNLGESIAIGDVTGDGIADLVVSAPSSQGSGNAGSSRGEVVVIAGSTTLPTSIDLSSGSPLRTYYGVTDSDFAGVSVAVGDVNADGIGDIVVGVPYGDGPTDTNLNRGEVYVIFGSSSLPATGVLSSTANVIVYGRDDLDELGFAVAVGDVNGDGRGDLAATAIYEDSPGAANTEDRGGVSILYGRTTWPATINLNTTAPDISLHGVDNGDGLGFSIAIGYLNADAYADVALGAPSADGPANARSAAGDVYVLLGSATPSTVYDLGATLAGVSGVYGREAGDMIGARTGLAIGNVINPIGNGVQNLVIGMPNADGPGNTVTEGGETAVWPAGFVFSGFIYDMATTAPSAILHAPDPSDWMGQGVGAVDVNGDGFADAVASARLGDGPLNANTNRGELRILAR
ncbi:MAG: Ig-like domain-containing protein [Planctomycetales bacterium]|nr:Ig-like domain-containing protein [Planctomycetales bacterium]